MNEEQTITFKSGRRYLAIELHERPYRDSDSEWDRAAIRATITAEAGPLRARLAMLVWDQDIANLAKTLRSLEKMVGREATATTTFGGYEDLVNLSFELDKRGALALRVTVVDDPLTSAEMWFLIEADQSYLSGWISDVENLLRNLAR